MNAILILGPLLAQMFLTAGMFALLAVRKAQAVRLKKVNRKRDFYPTVIGPLPGF